MVPRQKKKFRKSRNRIKKYQLLEVFISFLLRLLYHKTDSINVNPCKDGINNLEKEMRFLHTILGHAALVLCDDDDEHKQVQNLFAEFEEVANKAGGLVHSLLFSINPAIEKLDKGLAVVLSRFDLLRANIMKFLQLLPTISRSANCLTPKTSVVDSLLIVDSLIYDLEDLMNREADIMIGDVNDQIKMLHQGLIVSKSSIKDTGSPQPSEIGELKQPLMQIGDMAHEAEYLIISFLVGDVPLSYLINRLTDINQKINVIDTLIQEITKKYKFGSLKVAKYFSTQLSPQDKINAEVDDIAVGFDDKITDILHQLVGGTERLQVISIFGMPGLGKTTLAKKSYNNPTVNCWFDKLVWCVVSQTYLRQSTLANILIHVKRELDKDRILRMDEESLIEHIYKTLKRRRYLIVMDDIWDSNVWDDLRRCFPDDGNGSRILFTSRSKDVAPSDSINYPLPHLSNDQCWELLEKKVFDNKPCPPELLWIGKKIAANCYGLPLTVVVIAGILSTINREKGTWEEVVGNLASHVFDGGDNTTMQILTLSYKHLPEYLKSCFLYFGAFQEDEEISVRMLTRLWIAEGFIHKEEKKSLEDVAEEYLMELIDKSLVMIAKRRSDGGVKTCVIHDLLRELCLRRSEEERFLKCVKADRCLIYKGGHRLKAHQCSLPWSCCQHVHSFHGRKMRLPLYVRDTRLLRVLHFDYVNTHYIGIEYLVYLRYLVISDLSASIGSLVNLEYLRVETNKTVYLPSAIMKMKKLRYFHVGFEARYDEDCSSSQTNNLEFLSHIWIGGLKDEKRLKCSPHLRKLKCRRVIYSSILIWECQHFDLRFFTQLESLNVKFFGFKLEEISFPLNIKKLTLKNVSMLLPREIMSIIGKLESLEILKLSYDAFVEERWDTRDGEFQKLRFLKLEETDLTEWNVDSSQHFPKLQQLVLKDCNKLEEIPSEIGEVSTLQLIQVHGQCPKQLVESAKRIQQEQCDLGNEELRILISAHM